MTITKLTWSELQQRAAAVADRVPVGSRIYGVPRGGVMAAMLLNRSGNYLLADTPDDADVFVDDIVDSGRTRARLAATGKPFVALVDKTNGDSGIGWVQFPWEAEPSSDVEDSVVRLLQFIGEDPTREGLKETPRRVVKAWREMTEGYALDPHKVLGTDFDADGYDEMIVCRDIEFVSTCEHHLLPFVGVAHIGYIPGTRVVGLSKMARLVDCFARRLQIQEKLTRQVADAMEQVLKPRGVGVVLSAKHSCMACRGVRKQSSSMTTTALTGMFREQVVRAEFFAHIAR